MTLKQPLTVEVYLHDEACEQAEALGKHLPLVEHTITKVTLYAVSSLVPLYVEEMKKNIAMVNSYGDTFHTVAKYKDMKALIAENLIPVV